MASTLYDYTSVQSLDFTTEIMASVEVELGVTPETTYSISGKQLKFDSESDIAPYIKELTEKKMSKS